MSMELDTAKHGVTRPPPESYEERGKRLKPEQEPKLNPKQKRTPMYDWETKPGEDLRASDFSMFDDDPEPFMFRRDRFVYMNKAFIKEEQEIEVAMADYYKRSRNLSPFDAIRLPEISHSLNGITPLDMDDRLRVKLTPLCELALNKYNAENQGAKFVLADIVKTTWRPGGIYYITFQAKEGEGEEDPSNSPTTTFQAHVRMVPRNGPHQVFSCAIKT